MFAAKEITSRSLFVDSNTRHGLLSGKGQSFGKHSSGSTASSCNSETNDEAIIERGVADAVR